MKDTQIFVGIVLHFLDLFSAIFSKSVIDQWPPQAGLSVSLLCNFFFLFSKLDVCASSFLVWLRKLLRCRKTSCDRIRTGPGVRGSHSAIAE